MRKINHLIDKVYSLQLPSLLAFPALCASWPRLFYLFIYRYHVTQYLFWLHVNQKHGIVSDANLVDCIKQARVESTHEVLEIGFGWGALAIQLVRRTGCRYIGITLSKEQLTFAQAMVKEACLEVLVLLFHTFFSFFTKTTHLNLSYCL
jgi:tRNA1(Val) A37 N6-methylase TrmN6